MMDIVAVLIYFLVFWRENLVAGGENAYLAGSWSSLVSHMESAAKNR